jgi:chromosome segregation ATPase
MKNRKKFSITAIYMITLVAMATAIFPGSGLCVTGAVKVGDFDNKPADPLIGDFVTEVKETISTLKSGAKALEDVNSEFEDCSSILGNDPGDRARHTQCVIEKAQMSRDVYRQSKMDFEKLNKRLGEYRERTDKGVSQVQQALASEQKNLAQVQSSISQYERQARELIDNISDLGDDQELTKDQMNLIWEVADGLVHKKNMAKMLATATAKLETDIATLENGSNAVAELQDSVDRVIRNFDNRVEEANLFIRLTRSYSLTQARLMETADIIDAFNGVREEIGRVLTPYPDYTPAMDQVSDNSAYLIPPVKPHSVGDARDLLKRLVPKGEE